MLLCLSCHPYRSCVALLYARRRSPLKLIHTCEEEWGADFTDIDAHAIANRDAQWPPAAATALRNLVLSATGAKCLCHPSARKRLSLEEVLRGLQVLADDSVGAANDATAGAAAAPAAPTASAAPPATAGGYMPSPLSVQVRALSKGEDSLEGVKDNVLLAFGKLIGRLDGYYACAAARGTPPTSPWPARYTPPEGFEERIGYWQRECGMGAALADGLHRLRIWANAARHADDEKWRRNAPQSAAEASRRVAAVEKAIEALERAAEAGRAVSER